MFPCPHILSDKDGWPPAANLLRTRLGGMVGWSVRTSIGERRSKAKNVNYGQVSF